jgi:hypothetical protein
VPLCHQCTQGLAACGGREAERGAWRLVGHGWWVVVLGEPRRGGLAAARRQRARAHTGPRCGTPTHLCERAREQRRQQTAVVEEPQDAKHCCCAAPRQAAAGSPPASVGWQRPHLARRLECVRVGVHAACDAVCCRAVVWARACVCALVSLCEQWVSVALVGWGVGKAPAAHPHTRHASPIRVPAAQALHNRACIHRALLPAPHTALPTPLHSHLPPGHHQITKVVMRACARLT